MQFIKKQDIQDKNVAKAQPLVEASYNFSIWEKRVYTILASLVNKNDPDFKSYRINIGDIIDFYECKSHDAYDRIREVPESLLSKNKIIRIPYTTKDGNRRILKTHLITAATEPAEGDYHEDNGYIELEFHPKLKPFLLGLKRYLCYDIKNTVGISSVHSLRIFEFLKLHQYKGQHRITVLELKIMLGLENKHKKYGHFKRIITKAQKDLLKNTDIRFEFDEIKKGRAVYALNFRIYENEPQQPKTQVSSSRRRRKPASSGSSAAAATQTLRVSSKGSKTPVSQLAELVPNWGLSQTTLKLFLDSYSFGYIKERIDYIEAVSKNKFIQNKAGYLRKLLEQQDWVNPVNLEKQRARANREEKNAQRAASQKAQEDLQTLRRNLNQEENRIIDEIFVKNMFAKQNAIEQTRRSSLARQHWNENLSFEDNFDKNTRFRIFVYAEAKKMHANLLEAVRESYQQKMDALKQKM